MVKPGRKSHQKLICLVKPIVLYSEDLTITVPVNLTLGSLSSYDNERRGQHRLKNNLYFAYEFCNTLKSSNLLFFVKTVKKLNLVHSNKSETKF